MIILKKDTKIYRFNCQDCGTELIAERSDLKINDSVGFGVREVSFLCPICKRMRYVRKADMHVKQISAKNWKEIEP